MPAQRTGRTVAPHLRRGHFHTYRVGPGRTERAVRWLAPIPVNLGVDPEQTTVVRV